MWVGHSRSHQLLHTVHIDSMSSGLPHNLHKPGCRRSSATMMILPKPYLDGLHNVTIGAVLLAQPVSPGNRILLPGGGLGGGRQAPGCKRLHTYTPKECGFHRNMERFEPSMHTSFLQQQVQRGVGLSSTHGSPLKMENRVSQKHGEV